LFLLELSEQLSKYLPYAALVSGVTVLAMSELPRAWATAAIKRCSGIEG
jgi:hypothetical protein